MFILIAFKKGKIIKIIPYRNYRDVQDYIDFHERMNLIDKIKVLNVGRLLSLVPYENYFKSIDLKIPIKQFLSHIPVYSYTRKNGIFISAKMVQNGCFLEKHFTPKGLQLFIADNIYDFDNYYFNVWIN